MCVWGGLYQRRPYRWHGHYICVLGTPRRLSQRRLHKRDPPPCFRTLMACGHATQGRTITAIPTTSISILSSLCASRSLGSNGAALVSHVCRLAAPTHGGLQRARARGSAARCLLAGDISDALLLMFGVLITFCTLSGKWWVLR